MAKYFLLNYNLLIMKSDKTNSNINNIKSEEPKKYLTMLQKKLLLIKLRNSKPPQYIIDKMNNRDKDQNKD